MNLIARLSLISLLGLLVACAGEKDNSEPPAPLVEIENPLRLGVNWKRNTQAGGSGASYRLRPLIIADRVFSIDTDGTISTIELASGKELWRFETGLSAIAGLGGQAQTIVATSQDGDIAAYDRTDSGLELRWKIQVDSEIRAVPVVDDDQVFIRSVDGKLRSLAALDGALQWEASRRVPSLTLTGNSEPLVTAELVYSGFDDGKLVAYARDSGELQWEATISLPRGRTEVERLVDLDGSFVLRDGVIYIASFQGRLAALQALSGDLLWSRDFSSYQSIAIDEDAIYLSADDSDIWSIDRRTGAAFWKQEDLHARRITAPSIVGDKLVVADLQGYLHWLNKSDGRLVGRIRTSERRNYVRPLTWQSSVLTLDRAGYLASVSVRQ